MSIDLEIIKANNDDTLSAVIWPHPTAVSGVYALVQRVVKCLFTVPGGDAWDPTFGADLIGAVAGIPAQAVAEARKAVSAVFRKCCNDLAPTAVDPGLQDLNVEDLVYEPETGTWRITVSVETSAGTFQVPVTV